MLRLLSFLWTGCSHKWEVLRRVNVFDGGTRPIATRYELQCGKCGNVKSKDCWS